MSDFICGFFEEDITFWKLRVPVRLTVPLFVVVATKVVGAVFLFYWLNVQSVGTFWFDSNRVFSWEQNTVFLQTAVGAGRWSYLFVGWDSAWYLSIMTKGYAFSPQSYTFLPGLPVFGALFGLVLHNPLAAMATCSLIFGILWVPIYQLLAENYISKQAAMWSTLLFALSPYAFLFTTVAYGESLLLFFSVSALYLFKRGKVGCASGLAAVAALTRITGILVIVPMVLASLKQKSPRRRNIILSLLPITTLALWFVYFQLSTGDLLAPVHTTEWSGLYTVRSLLLQDLPQRGLQAFSDILSQNWPATQFWITPLSVACALIIPPFLIYKTAKIDKALAVYSLAGYVGILIFGAIVSTPRFTSMLFPLWLPLTAKITWGRKSEAGMIVALFISLIFGLAMWISFLDGQFVA